MEFEYQDISRRGRWIMILGVVLALVAVGSLGLWLTLWQLRPREGGVAFWLAVVGLTAFCFQTAVLDALVWTALFPA